MVAIKRSSSTFNGRPATTGFNKKRVHSPGVAHTVSDSAQDAKTSHQMQKLVRLQRKAGKTSAFELIQELKKLWEQLRMKSIEKSQRKSVVSQTMKIVKGHVLEVIFKHDSSRIIQSLIKYSNPTDAELGRPAVFEELSGQYVNLSTSPYGRFVVLKALKYAPNAGVRSEIVSEFLKPNTVLRLIRHKYAELVIDTIYCLYVNSRERQIMVEQFYGVEYQIIRANMSEMVGQVSKTLSVALAESANKRTRILEQLKNNLVNIVMKEGTVGRNEIVHRVIYDYMSQLSFEELKDVFSTETAPFFPLLAQIPAILHTKYGSQISMLLISAAGAKERKGILKAMKPHAKEIALNEFGWHVLCRAYDAVDDTVLLKNSLTSEIFGKEDTPIDDIIGIFTSKSVRKLVMYLICGKNTKFFSPDLIKTLSAGEEYLSLTSKKDPVQRKQEIVKVIFPLLIRALAELPVVDELMRENSGGAMLLEVMKFAKSNGYSTDNVCACLVRLCEKDIVWPLQDSHVLMSESENDSGDESDDDKASDVGASEPEQLEISKNYLQTGAKSVSKGHLLLDKNAPRSIKKLLGEFLELRDLFFILFDKSRIVAMKNLAEITPDMPVGPFFLLTSLYENGTFNYQTMVKETIGTGEFKNAGLSFIQKCLVKN